MAREPAKGALEYDDLVRLPDQGAQLRGIDRVRFLVSGGLGGDAPGKPGDNEWP